MSHAARKMLAALTRKSSSRASPGGRSFSCTWTRQLPSTHSSNGEEAFPGLRWHTPQES